MADVRLRSVKFPGLTDKYVVKDYDEDIETISEDLEEAQTALETKAEIDGYYDEMAVGSAEQLISTVTVEDKVPYQFRTSGGSADIGNRETDTIVGGTVAWNQLLQASTTGSTTSGITKTVSGGKYTFSGTATADVTSNLDASVVPFQANHVYALLGFGGGSATTYYFGVSGTSGDGYGFTFMSNKMFKPTGSRSEHVRITIKNGYTADFSIIPQVFDLTQALGATIADYIYSLEQSTAGAGVAFFRKLFPKPYYAYDAGTLKHVEGLASHDTTGFNQWDEKWEVGSYNINTGDIAGATDRIRCKNYIPCVPSASYYFTTKTVASALWANVLFYDANKNYISYTGVYSPSSSSSAGFNNPFTTPSNAYYMRFYLNSTYGTTYKHDICINLHWDGERDGEYEAYVKHSYPLDDSIVLRGLMKLDANNQPYYYGDTYESDGTVTRYFGVVDLGTLTWSTFSDATHKWFYVASTNMPSDAKLKTTNSIGSNNIVSKYVQSSMLSAGVWEEKTFYYGGTFFGTKAISVCDSAYANNTGTEFKTAMSGVYLVYELATPTEETAEPYTNPQICDDFGTEEYVTESIVPVGHDTFYMNNLRAKLEMAPASPDSEGDYIVRHENGENSYVPLIIPSELPDAPGSDGTYVLKVTVASGEATYSWEEET